MLQVLKQVSRTCLRPSVQIVSLINSEHPESPALLRAKGDQTLAENNPGLFLHFPSTHSVLWLFYWPVHILW